MDTVIQPPASEVEGVTVRFPQALLVASREDAQQFQQRVMIQTLGLLYEQGKISSGLGAQVLLAQEIRPDWVIIDERLARRVAQALGLPVKGALGILLAAVWAGLLTRQSALDALEQLLLAGIRISPRWQHWFRTEVGKAQL
jgi:predicted nucleic acid-binding protein